MYDFVAFYFQRLIFWGISVDRIVGDKASKFGYVILVNLEIKERIKRNLDHIKLVMEDGIVSLEELGDGLDQSIMWQLHFDKFI